MKLAAIRRLLRRHEKADVAVDAYLRWRRECVAVRGAYRAWVAAGAGSRPLAFDAYIAALDREECAARIYAGLKLRIGQVAELGLAHELADL
jgi:hypothetical protein